MLHDLDGRIDAVLDGGPTTVGVESTIVDVSRTPPRLLRPGGLAAEAIEAVLGDAARAASRRTGGAAARAWPAAGALLAAHAADADRRRSRRRAQRGCVAEVEAAVAAGQRVGVLALEDDAALFPARCAVEVVGAWSDPARRPRGCSTRMRALDAADLDVLFARELADPVGRPGPGARRSACGAPRNASSTACTQLESSF